MAPTEFQAATAITVISPAGKYNLGFTLIELMLVLMLLGLSTLVVLPNIDKGMQEREVRGSALGLAAVARELRSRALHEGMPRQLVLNLSTNSYLVDRSREFHLPANVKFGAVEGGETLEAGARRFLFFPNGSTLGGAIVMSSSRDAASYSIRFEPLTGRIEVLRRERS